MGARQRRRRHRADICIDRFEHAISRDYCS
jgi:hypothetical protein